MLIGCSQNANVQSEPSLPNGNSAGNTAVNSATQISNDKEQQPSTTDPSDQPAGEDIETNWQNSPHAITYVVDDAGQNNNCAQCHAPTDWQPSMDSIPESCFSCKFELKDPPAYIAEQDWNDIPCYVCHEVDKHDEVQPEIAWLEIAAIGEYAEVESGEQLCKKCHLISDPPEGHKAIGNFGAHEDETCVSCHDPHSTTADCIDCHEDVDFTAGIVTGHDLDHADIPCIVCHDNSGLQADINAETGQWHLISQEGEEQTNIIVSHNLAVAAPCSRCHYADNPWSLSTQP